MMGDSSYLALFKADFSDLNNINGTMVLKCSYRDILYVDIHRKDQQRINLTIVSSAISYKSSLDIDGDMTPGNPYEEHFVDRATLGAQAEMEAAAGPATEMALYFDDKAKAQQTRTFIDYARDRASKVRDEAVEGLLYHEEELCVNARANL